MNSIAELVKQVQELTDLTQAQVRTIEEKDDEIAAERHAFKNFHRMLCERFGYTHDEVDWKRDQVSLLEFIAQAQAPVAASADPIVEMNVAMLRERSAVGVKKYGVTMADSGLTHRQWLQHALEEGLDQVNYLQAAIQTLGAEPAAPQQHAQAAQQFDFATLLMYPEEWDVAAYPTIESAMWEMISCAKIASAVAHERNAAKQVPAPAQPIAGELPMLPEPASVEENDEAFFDADQMRTYGHQCRAAALLEAEVQQIKQAEVSYKQGRAAALEEAAKVCMEQTNYMTFEREAFAAAIRLLKDK